MCVCVWCCADQQYDAETDLRRQRKEKEKRIEKFQESAKKKKQQESKSCVCVCSWPSFPWCGVFLFLTAAD